MGGGGGGGGAGFIASDVGAISRRGAKDVRDCRQASTRGRAGVESWLTVLNTVTRQAALRLSLHFSSPLFVSSCLTVYLTV